jgi:hypothetical protein
MVVKDVELEAALDLASGNSTDDQTTEQKLS